LLIESFVRELAWRLDQVRTTLTRDTESLRSALQFTPERCAASRMLPSESSLAPPGELAEVAAQKVVFELLAERRCGREPVDEQVAQFPAGADTARWMQTVEVEDLLGEIRDRFRAIDPLIHLHELLMRHTDAETRRRCGVFYTPAPIVRWIVRAAAAVRRWSFDRDLDARYIDPCCGSGAFLSGVIEHVSQQKEQLKPGALVGFEVLPATQVVALTLLGRQLEGDWRRLLQIECVNPLTAGEALAAQVLGEGDQLPVILGNPPYANFGRQNKGPWISRLLRDYKTGLNERKLNLDDDFIKFLRWGQYWIERAGRGVLAMITSRTYLDGLTHRAMRRSLAGAFDEIYLLDLGGDIDARREELPRAEDENVFGIRRGVAIGVFVKTGASSAAARVRYYVLRGTRDEKFAALDAGDLDSTPWQTVTLRSPQNDFVPQRRRPREYRTWPRIVDVLPQYISGVQTKNDAILTDFRRNTLAQRMRTLLDGGAAASRSAEYLDPTVEMGRRRLGDRLAGLLYDKSRLREYLVAPFDRRWIYYEPRLVGRARFGVMRHMLHENVALIFMRQSTCEGPYDHFLATDTLASDRVFYSTHGAPFLAPLWLWEEDGHGTELLRRANFDADFAREFAERLKMRYRPNFPAACSNAADAIGPEDLFHYLYASFFRTDYRRRYDDDLRVDFPRVPPIDDAERFGRLCRWGRRLVDLHLGRSTSPRADVHSRQSPCLDDAAQPLRQWRLGGYAVLPRWLRQRRRRPLSGDERFAFNCLLDAVAETIRIVRKIDAV
jgi:predicted helicase